MTSRSMVSISMILTALPLVAHHRQAVYFDTTKLVTRKGVIAGVEWINPQSFLHLDVKGGNGDVVRWLVEIPSPNFLTRQVVTKDSVKQGDEMTIGVWVAKDRSPRGDCALGQKLQSARLADRYGTCFRSLLEAAPIPIRLHKIA